MMDSMEGRSIVNILEGSAEEPGREHLKINMSALIHDIKPNEIEIEMEDTSISHHIANGRRDSEEEGIGEALADLEGEAGGGLSVDGFVMVGVIVLVEP